LLPARGHRPPTVPPALRAARSARLGAGPDHLREACAWLRSVPRERSRSLDRAAGPARQGRPRRGAPCWTSSRSRSRLACFAGRVPADASASTRGHEAHGFDHEHRVVQRCVAQGSQPPDR